MPLSVENLNSNSTHDQINQAISDSIAKLMDEGKTQEQAAGQAFGMARDRTGKALDFGKS